MLQLPQQKTIAVIGDSVLDAYDDGDYAGHGYADFQNPVTEICARAARAM